MSGKTHATKLSSLSLIIVKSVAKLNSFSHESLATWISQFFFKSFSFVIAQHSKSLTSFVLFLKNWFPSSAFTRNDIVSASPSPLLEQWSRCPCEKNGNEDLERATNVITIESHQSAEESIDGWTENLQATSLSASLSQHLKTPLRLVKEFFQRRLHVASFNNYSPLLLFKLNNKTCWLHLFNKMLINCDLELLTNVNLKGESLTGNAIKFNK